MSMTEGEKTRTISSLYGVVMYALAAWIIAKLLTDAPYWKVLGALVVARTAFSVLEGLGGILMWRTYGRRQMVGRFYSVLQGQGFPKRYREGDDFLSYLARVDDDKTLSPEVRQAAKQFYAALGAVEETGILAGMRVHAASELALERYSPKAEAPLATAR